MRADGYDEVAKDYADKFLDELSHKPFDRDLLDKFALRVRPLGPVCDLGCGPGQVARYLRERGADVFGIDGSSAMASEAKKANGQLHFVQGDMRRLPLSNESLGGIAALYSLIHLAPEELTGAMAEWRRVLKCNAPVLIAFHVGDETIHLSDWWEKEVDLDFHFFQSSNLCELLGQVGFQIESSLERPPYEPFEHPSTRGYILASKLRQS